MIDRLLMQYERMRQQEIDALASRRAQVLSMHPDFEALSQRRQLLWDDLHARVRCGSVGAQDKARLREMLAELDVSERTLLEKCGLPPDYLTLHVHCERCNDKGFIGEGERRRCACFEQALQRMRRDGAHIDDTQTFSQFHEEIAPNEQQRKQLRAAKKIALDFAEKFPDTKYLNLIFMGAVGLGKTFFLNCIAARVVERGFSAENVTAYHLQQRIMEGFRGGRDGAQAFVRAPLLLIDDLGAEPLIPNVTIEYLFSILNERRIARRQTVIATNLDQAALQAHYGERVFSRLFANDDAGVLLLTGDSLRLRGKKEEGGAL